MIVVNRGADDDKVVNDGGRGSHVIPARVVLENVAQADYAVLPKIWAGGAGGGIHRHEAGVLRGFEDAAMAGLVFGARAVEPGGNTTIDQAVAVIAVEIDFWVVGPALLAGFGIERDDAVEGGGEKESAVDKKGCSLKAAALSAASGFRNVASVKGPCNFELRDVFAIDLR